MAIIEEIFSSLFSAVVAKFIPEAEAISSLNIISPSIPSMPRFVPANRVFPQTVSVPGYNHFLTPLRKLIFDYDPLATSHHGIRCVSPKRCATPLIFPRCRTYIRRSLIPMASENPDVEVLVRKLRRGQPALLRGHYGELNSIVPRVFLSSLADSYVVET